MKSGLFSIITIGIITVLHFLFFWLILGLINFGGGIQTTEDMFFICLPIISIWVALIKIYLILFNKKISLLQNRILFGLIVLPLFFYMYVFLEFAII